MGDSLGSEGEGADGRRQPGRSLLLTALVASVASLFASSSTVGGWADRGPPRGEGRWERKAGPSAELPEGPVKVLGTLVHTHTGERLPLDSLTPTDARFDELLADGVTGASHAIDARILALLRRLAALHPGARFEIVSGFRSEKLNEMRRKKGRHVASHSQHSLGQALDFRVVPRGAGKGVDPRTLEKEIRALGWDGGVGVYLLESDWFVHADVGKNRRWRG